MWDWKVWQEVLQDTLREFRFIVQHEVERFTFELENWVNHLVSRPLPTDWRQQTVRFLLDWEAQGYRLTPRSMVILEWWIEAWSKKRGFWPPRDEPPATADGKIWTTVETIVVGPTDADLPPEPAVGSQQAKHAKVSKYWPALTPGETAAAQRSTGVPWWYPIQPRNRIDGVWRQQAEQLGQAARDQLLAFYREVAALGRMAKRLEERDDGDLDPLLAQRQKVQAAYDRYLEQRTEIHRAWTRYLRAEWFVGPEVAKVFDKIQNALPNRVEGFESPLDAKLRAARRASHEAIVKKRQRTEMAYTGLDWADKVITAIEIASLVGSAKAVVKATFKRALAKGFSSAAARKIAVAHGVARVATAAASVAVAANVVPEVLAAAGLDESEVRAGLAVFRAVLIVVGVRTLSKRGLPKRSTPRDRKAKNFLKHLRMREGKAAEAGRAYPHQQVHIDKPNGKGYWKLDFYDPAKGEIVSFKDTQLANVKVKSAIGYLNELARKYKPGSKIADVPSTSKDLLGKSLEGRMFLEVPVQTKPIPQKVLDAATKRRIKIRDTNGKLYN